MDYKQLVRSILGLFGLALILLRAFSVIDWKVRVDNSSYVLLIISIILLYFKELKELIINVRVSRLKIGEFEVDFILKKADSNLKQIEPEASDTETFTSDENHQYQDLIVTFKQIDEKLRQLMEKNKLEDSVIEPISSRKISAALFSKGLISRQLFIAFNSLMDVRNKIIHDGLHESYTFALEIARRILSELKKI